MVVLLSAVNDYGYQVIAGQTETKPIKGLTISTIIVRTYLVSLLGIDFRLCLTAGYFERSADGSVITDPGHIGAL